MAVRVGYSLAEAERRVVDCQRHLRRCAQIIARQPDGDALPSTVGEAVTNAVAATELLHSLLYEYAAATPTRSRARSRSRGRLGGAAIGTLTDDVPLRVSSSGDGAATVTQGQNDSGLRP